MASANRTAYILKTINDALATETTFDVRLVWRGNMAPTTKALVYAFVAGQTFNAFSEDGRVEYGEATVVVWCDLKAAAEGTTPTGKTTTAYADALEKIERAISGLTLPLRETHTGNRWRTTINNVYIAAEGGHVDNADNSINADAQIIVNFTHERLP